MFEQAVMIYAALAALACLAVVLHMANRARSRSTYWIVAACFWLTASRLGNVFDLGWYSDHNRTLGAVTITLLLVGFIGLDLAMRHYPRRPK